MKNTLTILLILSWTSIGAIGVAEPVDTIFTQRRDAVVANIWKATPPDLLKNVDRGVEMALLLLFKNEKVDEANRMVMAYCGGDKLEKYVGRMVPKNRCEAVLRIYLLERTRKLLTREVLGERRSAPRRTKTKNALENPNRETYRSAAVQ